MCNGWVKAGATGRKGSWGWEVGGKTRVPKKELGGWGSYWKKGQGGKKGQ